MEFYWTDFEFFELVGFLEGFYTVSTPRQYVKILTSVCSFLGIASRTPAGPIREVGRPVEGWWRKDGRPAQELLPRGRRSSGAVSARTESLQLCAGAFNFEISAAGIRRWCDPSVGPGHAFASKAVLPASVL
ncbi:unnamed protein product [Nesidiocoris tenuis]|uniref:Uncharacterized protein n=1 Tax=Nesidiocoris tenuis TaxID=355587 RepID=A0A6H5HIQ5_9HEMI|nr:unnamed protein product [Nesidiocoris tenuis]